MTFSNPRVSEYDQILADIQWTVRAGVADGITALLAWTSGQPWRRATVDEINAAIRASRSKASR